MQLKWLSNSPKNPFCFTTLPGETQLEARERYQRWTSDKIKGEPKATDKYSASELINMGFVGFYAVDLEAQIQRLNDLLKPLKEAVQIYESIDIKAEHDRAINQLRLIRPLVQAISHESVIV